MNLYSVKHKITPVKDVKGILAVEEGCQLEPGAAVIRATIEPCGPEPQIAMEGDLIVGVGFDEPDREGSPIHQTPILAVLQPALRKITSLVTRMEIVAKGGSLPTP
jgi:hypothetical protein